MPFSNLLAKKIEHGGSRSFIQRAIALGVTVEMLLEKPRVLKLTHGGKTVFAVGSDIPIERRTGRQTTANKIATKAILSSVGVRVPRGIVARSFTEAKKMIADVKLQFPLISKPLDESLALGVTWNITDLHELNQGVKLIESLASKPAKKKSFIIEEMVQGEEYRVLVFNGAVLSCVQKIPASVQGDGKSTLQQLIKNFNKTRRHGFEIKIDSTVRKTLRAKELTLSSVLKRGVTLRLRHNLNMSDGGRSIECTKEMSPFLQKKCLLALSTLGIQYGGIDLMTPDISNSRHSYAILEVNDRPYFNMHEKPLVEGTGVDIAGVLLHNIFPTLPNPLA